MTKLSDYANHPGYDAAASVVSRGQITWFIVMSVIKFFIVDYTVSLLWGAIFVAVGMFTVSLVIAAPMFFLMLKVPVAKGWIDLLGSAITLAVTYFAFDMVLGPSM